MANLSVANCTTCNKEFHHKKQKAGKFCSIPCYRAWQKSPGYLHGRPKKYNGDCAHCSKAVYGKDVSVCRNGKKSDKIFCDRDCYNNYRIALRASTLSATSTKCKGCDATVGALSKKGVKPLYCSFECRVRHKTPKPQVCVNCGHEFCAIKWFKGRKRATRVTHAKTCSAKCHNQWIRNNPERKRKISEAFRGEKHPNWQGGPTTDKGRHYRGAGWTRIRKEIRKRDNYTCQDCGVTEAEHGRALDVHHKRPFNQFNGDNEKANKPSNLITLCKKCHTNADWAWRLANPIQITLSLDGDSSKPRKPSYPSDLTGLTFNDVTVIGKADTDSNSNCTKWKYVCNRCGSKKEAWRSVFVQTGIYDCGCGRKERRKAAWKKRAETRKYVWHVDGVDYGRAADAAKVHGVTDSTISVWCKGRKSQGKGIRAANTKAVDGWIPPRENCWYGLRSKKTASQG